MRFRMLDECPLCGKQCYRYQLTLMPDAHTIQVTEIDEIHYVICECGLIFQQWPMTPKTLLGYYKSQYREIIGTSKVTDRNIKEETIRAKNILEFTYDTPSNVLDIGSSTGILLKKLRGVYECQVTGIEPGDKFRAYSQNLGLNVLESIDYLNGNHKYDLITIIHVLEHFIEPMALLEKVRGFMAENGILIIEVPLMDYRLAHPIVFTEETFRKMLHRAGFKIDWIVIDENLIAEAHLDT